MQSPEVPVTFAEAQAPQAIATWQPGVHLQLGITNWMMSMDFVVRISASSILDIGAFNSLLVFLKKNYVFVLQPASTKSSCNIFTLMCFMTLAYPWSCIRIFQYEPGSAATKTPQLQILDVKICIWFILTLLYEKLTMSKGIVPCLRP